jgi:lysophospholipase L1-like esterase
VTRGGAAALVACALLAGCGGPKATVPKLAPDAVVLAFGDSLTYGTGAGRGDSYPALLEARIGRKVVNAGVPGETSAEGLARLPDAIDDAKPALLVLCHGGNDFLRRMDEARAADNLRAMIRIARDKGVPVLLLATPRPSLPPAVPEFYAALAKELAVPYEEAIMRSVLTDNRLKSDLVHPNAQGYAQIAAAVEGLMRRSGAL